MSHNEKITIFYQNCRGTRTKLNTIYFNILSNNYDVIIITESWLTPEINDSEFIDDRYSVFRCDRDRIKTNKKDGGGVWIAVLKELKAVLHHPYLSVSPHIEHVVVEIPGPSLGRKNLIIASYIPPNSNDSLYMTHLEAMHKLVDKPDVDGFIIVGDYNLPAIQWARSNTENSALSCSRTGRVSQYIADFMNFFNAYQFNDCKNCNDNILDVLITNKECSLTGSQNHLCPPDKLHPPLSATVTFKTSYTPLKRKLISKLNFHKANYDLINRDITNTNWDDILSPLKADAALTAFYNKIHSIIIQHCPMSSPKNSNYPFWFSPALIHIFNNKKKAWVKWKKYNNLFDYEIFSLYRSRFKSEARKCYSKYIESVEDNVFKNSKYFWTYINNRKKKPGIPSSMCYKNTTANDPTNICNLFSDFFHSVYEPSTLLGDNFIPVPDYAPHDLFISDIHISSHKICRALSSVDPTKGPGSDGIPPVFLKNTAKDIYKPLSLIFNKCMSEGTFPTAWKHANIIPVHKSGPKNNVEKYRPISLLPALSKVFERLVHDEIYPSLHRIILPEQHGFTKNRSTTTNLMVFTNFVFQNLDDRTQTDAVYTDFQKAFDKVDHELLLHKIAFNGIRGNLLRWMVSYISNRTQTVVICGHQSNTIRVTSGVPQGSILGPLLFILFINDINTCFRNSKFLLYADDLKAFKSINSQNDCLLFQEDLDRLTEYCNNNKLHLSLPKCNFINFTKKRKITQFQYMLCHSPLNKVDALRDLGVILDSKLHLDQHIDSIVSKAYKMYGLVMRSTTDFSRPETLIHLYKSIIRPQLEYAVPIWNPIYKKYSDAIESVQRKYLRSVHFRVHRNRNHLSYTELLDEYGLIPLDSRRLILEAVTLYRLCHSHFDCTDLSNKLYYVVPRTVVRREARAYRMFATSLRHTNAGRRAPLCRIADSYNKHFEHIDMFSKFADFKNNIHKVFRN